MKRCGLHPGWGGGREVELSPFHKSYSHPVHEKGTKTMPTASRWRADNCLRSRDQAASEKSKPQTQITFSCNIRIYIICVSGYRTRNEHKHNSRTIKTPFLQSFPVSGSFQMSQFFTSGGQSIGVSASTSVLPMNIQDWFPLGWTHWISLKSKGLSRVFSTPQFKSVNSSALSSLYSPTLTSIHN